MADRNLVNYISSNMRRGVPYADIQSALLARGHSDYDITEAVNFINGVGSNQVIRPPATSTPKDVNYGLRYFFLGLFSLVVLIVIALIMIPIIKDAQNNIITISEGSLKQGKSFDLTKNNLIQFELNSDNYNFTVKSKGGNLVFSGSTEFILEQGEIKSLDIDEDGNLDYIISYSPLTENKIFIQTVCSEKWECSGWTNCFLGEEKRVCTDVNSCGTTSIKPDTVMECEYNTTIPANTSSTAGTTSPSDNESVEIVTIEILSCGAGSKYDTKDYCLGEVEVIFNSTDSWNCCSGEIVDALDLSDSLRSVWTSTASSGDCSGALYDAIFECAPHKCLTEGQILHRGVLGLSGTFCAYYEELPNSEEMYCEYSENDRKNVVGYYFLESSATEVVHNSSGTFLDGKITRNYPQEAIASGVCQTL